MEKIIAVLPGDGIGQEVVPQAIRVLKALAKKFHHQFILHYGDIGGTAFEKYNNHFPEITRDICQSAQAILLGAVGGPLSEADQPKWHNCERNSILALRKVLELNIYLQPIVVYPELAELSPLKSTRFTHPIDLLIIRELAGDIYFGAHQRTAHHGQRRASDMIEYCEEQILSIAHQSFQWARKRKKHLTSVDKATILETSKLWREIINEVASHYPDVHCEHILADHCARALITDPSQFDVILTSNLFGDILSGAASALPCSLGLIPSASLNNNYVGLYKPLGGAAPDIAGQNIANPIAQILSLALLLRYSFNLNHEAQLIEQAVTKTLAEGFRTKDIDMPGMKCVSTKVFTTHLIKNLF